MKIRNILPLVFFSLLVVSILLTILVSKWMGIAVMTIEVFLMFSIYAAFAKQIKEEGLYLNNTVLQNAMMGASCLGLFVMLFGLTFKIMHWPFTGPIIILGMVASGIPLIFFIMDVIINYRKTKTSYGYSYLIILLPAFVFIQTNIGKFFSDGNPNDMIVLKQTDDHRQFYSSIQDQKNSLFIERNFEKDTLVTKIHKTTENLLSFIYETRKKLITSTGGYINGDWFRMYKGAEEKITVEVFMVGSQGSGHGRAYRLKNMLDSYCSLLNQNIPDSSFRITLMALNAKVDPSVLDPTLKRKDFAELNFSNVNMLQAMNRLSQFELEVIIAEKEFLLYYQSTHK